EPKVIADDGRPAGLNLTRASLDAVTKYPWPRSEATIGRRDSGVRKFGVYDDDTAVFDFYRDGVDNGLRCIEAQVMDLADDISYSVHDVEDAIVAGHLDLADFTCENRRAELFDITRQWYLPEVTDTEMDKALSRLEAAAYWPSEAFDGSRRAQASLKHMTSQLIGRFVGAAEAATREEFGWEPLARYSASLVVPETSAVEIAVLKGMATLTVMVAEDRLRLHDIQAAVIGELAEWFSAAPDRLDPMFRADHAEAADDAARLRVIVDQIASLTDHSAWALYHRLNAGAEDRLYTMAGLIKRQDIAELRSRTRIDEVIGEFVTLKTAGIGSLKGLCPFHDEKTPSFTVRPQVGMYHCFGCGESGDVFTFLQKIEQLSFVEAVETLAGKAGMLLRYEDGKGPDREQASRRQRLLEMHEVA